MAAARRSSTGRRFRFSRDLVIRLLVVVPFTLVAGWLSVAVSGANLLRSTRPDLAMRLQPLDARSRARIAEQLATQPPVDRPQLAEAERLSLEALRRDPTLVVAWRTLAMIAAARNQSQRASVMFHFAGLLSKRDLPTQLWLIEERVQANDIDGALQHYDMALRAKPDSGALLFPVLVAAISNDGIMPRLARLLNTMPPWRLSFLSALSAGTSNPENLARFIGQLSRPQTEEERSAVVGAMRGLIDRRQYGPALRVYQLLTGGGAQVSPLLRNGAFDSPNSYPPLDWVLQDDGDFHAEQRPGDQGGTGSRLQIFAASGSGGVAARQLLLLAPGNYAIGAVAGPTSEGRPGQLGWSIQCVSSPTRIPLDQDLPRLSGEIRLGATFSIPGGCTGQWLSLKIRPDFDPGGTGAWMDSIVIQRR